VCSRTASVPRSAERFCQPFHSLFSIFSVHNISPWYIYVNFVNCVLGKEEPIETGEDGREVLKIILAAYQSAGEGRKIAWPYEPPAYEKPIDLWKPELKRG